MSNVKIQRLKGRQVQDYIPDVANLRMTVFREYPYLYDGDLAYEIDYLKTYSMCDEAILVIARDNDKIIGASTAVPMEFETPECQKPFIDNTIDIANIFYLGESLLLPEYRNQGIYQHYFKERETAAKEYGCRAAAFCAVVRQENDPRRPKEYTPLDRIWNHFGYQVNPQLCAYYKWKEIGEEVQTAKPMIFWMKNL